MTGRFQSNETFTLLERGRDVIQTVGRRYRYVNPRYMRLLGQTVFVTPWLMGAASAYLFAMIPQMDEIYLGIIEHGDLARGFGGLLAIALFSALLYCWNHLVVTDKIDAIYPDHADIYFDRGVIDVRNLKTLVTSCLPFIGLLLGLYFLYQGVLSDREQIQKVFQAYHNTSPWESELSDRLDRLPTYILIAMVIAALAWFSLIAFLHRTRNAAMWHRRFLYGCYVLTALIILVPMGASNLTILGSRIVGPLASSALVLIAASVLVRFLFWAIGGIALSFLTLPSAILMSFHSWPPLLRQSLIVITPLIPIILLGYKTIEVTNRQDSVLRQSILDSLDKRGKSDNELRLKLAATFADWLRARDTKPHERFPVFIVTAEGGGIYAASAASFFLATLQDHCPSFGKHVFAISAVSGGSVGASLFNAALAEQTGQTNAPSSATPRLACDQLADTGELVNRLRRVTEDDHISPILAYLLPDLFRAIAEFAKSGPERKTPCRAEKSLGWYSRDQILEKSFVHSFEHSRDPNAADFWAVCPPDVTKAFLTSRFADALSHPGTELPALLLNATWVETGYRVAFSPFPLQHLGEGTLYSFDDLGDLQQPKAPTKRPWQNPSVIEAAVVSARFPVIMPPWVSDINDKKRWTFVDGGYADSSGATTGLELFNELKAEINKALRPTPSPSLIGKFDEGAPLRKLGTEGVDLSMIDLHLIVLTDAFVEPDFTKLTAGPFDDFISPVNTLLTVRQLLARRAITRAYGQLHKDMIVIQLDQETFPLALGWKISDLSSDIIRVTMGMHAPCDPSKKDNPNWAIWTVYHNSCELERITKLLSGAAPMTLAAP